MPGATRVAGYNAWKNKFNRQVKKGERGIRIFAPIPFVVKEETEKLDPVTMQPIIGEDGQPVMEERIKKQAARFKVVPVFDVSQTEGEPLPALAENLAGDVERYGLFMDALRAASPLPIVFEDLPESTDGACRFGDSIALRSGMSEIQTVSAAIHEIAHAKLHDRKMLEEAGEERKDRRTEEVEAESVSYAVCQRYGIETGANTFGYVAEWSKGRELKELNASLDTIRKAAAELIDSIDESYRSLAKERGIELNAAADGQNRPAPEEAQSTTAQAAPTQAAPEAPDTNSLPGQVFADSCNAVAERAGAYMASSHPGFLSYMGEEAAREACSDCVKRSVSDLLQASADNLGLYRQYTGNPEFKERLEDYAFAKAYLEPRTKQRGAGPKQPARNAADKKLYEKFAAMFPDFASGKYRHLRLEADGFEPLSLEWVYGKRVAMMHSYVQNGDLCYDPMMEFRLDSEKGEMSAAAFEQSIPPLYQYIDDSGNGISVDGSGKPGIDKNLQAELNGFASQWLDNIAEQGFMPARASLDLGGGEGMQVTFGKDGKMIVPEPEGAPPATLDMSLPDPTITAGEMNAYGYAGQDMHPLSAGRAAELFDAGHTVYLLHRDGTEALAFEHGEITAFGGLCGITKADWDASPIKAAQAAIAENAAHGKEAELMGGEGFRFGIYQIPNSNGEARDLCFADMGELEKRGLPVERANYELVYTAEFCKHPHHGIVTDHPKALDEIYARFNQDGKPEGYRARSVSVSDVIALQWKGEVSAYYVDSAGFAELPGFFKEGQAFSQAGKSGQDKPPAPKSRPSLLGQLEEAKEQAKQNRQPTAGGAKKERGHGDD
jgi:hypothetical protein